MSDLQENTLASRLALVVIDNHSLRDVVYTLLEGDGYDVLAARTCMDGLNIFNRSVRLIDLLVTACTLPGMSAVELAQGCALRNKDVGILFISTWAPEKELPGELASGRRAFLSQPFRGEELLRGVRELLAPSPVTTSLPSAASISPAWLAF